MGFFKRLIEVYCDEKLYKFSRGLNFVRAVFLTDNSALSPNVIQVSTISKHMQGSAMKTIYFFPHW